MSIQVVKNLTLHARLDLGCSSRAPRVRESGRGSGDELVYLHVEFLGACGGVEVDFLVPVLATALEGFATTAAGNDAEREHFEHREQAEVAEKAEVLLPGGAFGEDGEGAFHDGLGLQQVIGGHGDEFVVRREVVDEVDEVALEVVGVAEEYELHSLSWIDLFVFYKNKFLTLFCHVQKGTNREFSELFVPFSCKLFVKTRSLRFSVFFLRFAAYSKLEHSTCLLC